MDKQDRKNSLGIAFSGGGLQGIAHIGAIKALYELGIHPQYVSGTSSGAAMATIISMGLEPDEMTQVAKENWATLAKFNKKTLAKMLAKFVSNGKNMDGLISGEIVSDVFKKVMDEHNIKGFKDLPINLTVCTVDTLSTDEVIFTTYDEKLKNEHIQYLTDAPLEIAVRASMSFPALYTTCKYQNYNFVDGGSRDNLPVKVLKDMGVGKVLAIGFDTMKYTPSNGLSGLMAVIWRSLDLYSIEKTVESRKLADFSVEIKNENTEIFSMASIDETVKEGYDAIMEHKDELVKLFK